MAEDLATDAELVFGRLYYALDARHRYTQADGSRVALFQMRVGGDRHIVNFPLLESVYADLAVEQQRFLIPVGISAAALVISLVALLG